VTGFFIGRFGHRGPLLAAAGLMVFTGLAFASLQSFWPLLLRPLGHEPHRGLRSHPR